ncbi:MAG: DUF1829 domain-containing protein [Armatimonadota bacterium]|jgi:hypothetical protein
MIDEIQELLDNYLKWLKDKTRLRQIEDWVEITTPYLDRHNDYFQIYVKKENSGYILNDDGYVIDDLETSGCKLDSPKRQELLQTILNGYGVQLSDGALQVRASSDNFALRKHNLAQAMLSVNDMFYLAQPTVLSLFFEDVVAWLDMQEIRYMPKIKFTGKSGFDHLFDFGIPKSRSQPERLLKVITHPSRDSVQTVSFSWLDTREVRPADSRFYVILNDTKQNVQPTDIEALRNYEVVPVPWSARQEVLQELAA